MKLRYALPIALVALVAFAAPAAAATYRSAPAGSMRIELTGYSWQDNTPPGSPDICCGLLHRTAGGQGTYADPITVAVPGSGRSMQFPRGTRFYLPSIKRYVIVEDSGASKYSLPYLDVWIDGRTVPARRPTGA